MTGRTHYDVLGVEQSATHDELRAAHRRLAHLLHPDHLTGVALSSSDRAAAERRIREVNEAWAVLGDEHRRAAYDRTLPAPPQRWVPPWENQPELPPRPLPPAPATVPFLPLVVTGIVVVVVVALVALTSGGTTSTPPPSTLAPGVCVRLASGPSVRAVDCGASNDGRLVGFATTTSGCPAGTDARRIDRASTVLGCLEPS